MNIEKELAELEVRVTGLEELCKNSLSEMIDLIKYAVSCAENTACEAKQIKEQVDNFVDGFAMNDKN
jgi:hypothetical protein|tara:strand:+ start:985 stop:1185 length:201 start_codon:yes stop_codon:yes gene_type:complete